MSSRKLRSAAASRAVSRAGARRRCASASRVGVLDGVALLVDDVVELVGDLVVDAAEVDAVEPLLALLAQPLEQLAQALQPFAVAIRACPAASSGAARC